MDPKRMNDATFDQLLTSLGRAAYQVGHRSASRVDSKSAEAEVESLRARLDAKVAEQAQTIARLEAELLAIAEATGFVNRPEGQGGYERATGERIAQAFREQDERAARLEREIEAGTKALALLRELNSYFDFDVSLDAGECGFDDPSGINDVFSRASQFLRDEDYAAALRTAATEDGT